MEGELRCSNHPSLLSPRIHVLPFLSLGCSIKTCLLCYAVVQNGHAKDPKDCCKESGCDTSLDSKLKVPGGCV